MRDKILPDSLVEPTYTKISKHHDLWAARSETKARKRLLKLAELQSGEQVVEVGVGTGLLFIEVLKEIGTEGFALGIDRTDAMLQKAYTRLGGESAHNFRLVKGDARILLEEDNRFDVAFSCYMLDLLPEEDIQKVLGELYRALRPGGRLLLANMTHAESAWHGGYALLARIDPRLFGGCRPIASSDFLQDAGFTVHSREYIAESWFPSEVTLSTKPES